MGSIYKFTDWVLAWLVPALNTSNLALSTLAYIGSQVKISQDSHFAPSPECVQRIWHDRRSVMPYDKAKREKIYYLLDFSWFERVWTVQEIQLSNSKSVILCGYDQIQ